MPNLLSEDNIQQAMMQRVQHLYGCDVMDCYTSYPANVQDGSGRADKREEILRDRLKAAAVKLHLKIPYTAIDSALDQVCDRRRTMATVAANRMNRPEIARIALVSVPARNRHVDGMR